MMRKKLIPLFNNETVPDREARSRLKVLSSMRGRMAVLWAIRENEPIDFTRLHEIVVGVVDYGGSRSVFTLIEHYLASAVRDLLDAGLVRLDGVEGTVTEAAIMCSSNITTTPQLVSMQNVFAISLSEYLYLLEDPVTAQPIFGSPETVETSQHTSVFVIMPFDEALKPLYDDHIAPVCQTLGLTCRRGDDYFSSQSVMDQVWSGIYFADICIADFSGKNPNVFYELGIADTLGRPTILITQSVQDIPFDIRHRRVIVYEDTPDGMKTFEERLTKMLQNELDLKPS